MFNNKDWNLIYAIPFICLGLGIVGGGLGMLILLRIFE